MIPFSIAHVGANDPFSEMDGIIAAKAAISIHGAIGQIPRPALDLINLRDGRDFLEESKEYDAVVLHSLFDPGPTLPDIPQTGDEIWKQVSRLHSYDKWRERLISTGARLILVFEMLPSSLHGWKLGDLEGYRILHRDHVQTVYLRKPTHANQTHNDHSQIRVRRRSSTHRTRGKVQASARPSVRR